MTGFYTTEIYLASLHLLLLQTVLCFLETFFVLET